jgi:ligand-binding sensor domain-containing protein/signal transduction histidine kinase/CheY-like chemotaxis protein
MKGWQWLLCGLLACANAQAAVPEIPRFRIMDAAQGLPSTTIPAMARDRQGYLWIATWDGLARYDGVGFKVWRHDPGDPQSLPGNVLQALHVDAQDRLWIAIEGGGLAMLDAGRRQFRHYRMADTPGMHSDDVFAITSVGDALWFGGFGSGLCRLGADGRITHFEAVDGKPNTLPSEHILALEPDGRGGVWVGTLAGLARYDGEAITRVDIPGAGSARVYSVTRDGERTWVGTAAGVFVREADGRWTAPPWSAMFARRNAVMALVNGGDGEYWLGTQTGLWRTEGEGAPVPVARESDGPDGGRVLQAILRQPDGGLWVGLPMRGLGYLRADWRRIAALSTAQGLSGGMYRGVAPARSGGVWLASTIGSVEHLDTGNGRLTPLPWQRQPVQHPRTQSVLEDDRGQLWLGGNELLIRLRIADGARQRWSADGSADAVPATGPVEWLVQTADGSLWLSSQGGGLQRRDPSTGEVLDRITADSGHGLTALDTEALQAGPDGTLWLAGAQGLLRWEPSLRRLEPVPGVGEGRIFSFVFQGADTVWVHRLSGLESWRRAPSGWTRERALTLADGVPAVESTGLQIDADNRLWLATRRGLFRVMPETGQVRSFGVRDGLLSQEFNDRALLLSGDGVLIGGAADGSVALLDTRYPDLPAPPPNLVIDALQVIRDDLTLRLPAAGGFTLQPSDHELQVSARLLSFEDPLANRYRSRLEGFEQGWVDHGASGERAFSALPPGAYLLRVQGFDAGGIASDERSIAFKVLPPWWRSGWGMAVFALLGLLLLAAAGALYRRRLRRKNAWQLAQHKRDLAEQASLAKTRFLATLGHEVRTPMTGVLGMSELLLATPLDERQRGYTHAIQNAGAHLLRLVNDALDIARIEAGKLELQPQDFDLRALVAEVAGLTAPVARQRGLRFHDRIDPTTPPLVRGDPLRVRQILLNLVGNAIKFTEHGDVRLEVVPGEGELLVFTVSDSGPGISQEQQARLFQRFEQAEGARTAARYGGSGLGLAICQELAGAMGGQIEVESAPGAGARFAVTLPLPAAEPAPGEAHPEPAAELDAVHSLSILLVEDDATVAEVIAGLLRARGHGVRHAAHGLAALTEMAVERFDIALLDLDLPGLDGLALARQMRQLGFTAPLLAVTARADPEAEAQALDAGFNGFLRKPVTGQLLADAVAGALRRTEAAAA